jgi:hypothetical protein
MTSPEEQLQLLARKVEALERAKRRRAVVYSLIPIALAGVLLGIAYFSLPILDRIRLYWERWNEDPSARALAYEQKEFWEKNFECPLQRRPIILIPEDPKTPESPKINLDFEVEVTICPSGDVLVMMRARDNPEDRRYQWVGFRTSKNKKRESLLFPAIQKVFAEEKRLPSGVPVAQYSPRVLCQKWTPNGLLIRRIQRNRDCQDELINPATGEVVRVSPAPCNSDC